VDEVKALAEVPKSEAFAAAGLAIQELRESA
jgi:hypothetical protein